MESSPPDNSNVRRIRAAVVVKGVQPVDNLHYLYDYEVCIGYQDVWYGARVIYQYKNAGD